MLLWSLCWDGIWSGFRTIGWWALSSSQTHTNLRRQDILQHDEDVQEARKSLLCYFSCKSCDQASKGTAIGAASGQWAGGLCRCGKHTQFCVGRTVCVCIIAAKQAKGVVAGLSQLPRRCLSLEGVCRVFADRTRGLCAHCCSILETPRLREARSTHIESKLDPKGS